jgi:hypothetical protein
MVKIAGIPNRNLSPMISFGDFCFVGRDFGLDIVRHYKERWNGDGMEIVYFGSLNKVVQNDGFGNGGVD